MQNYYDELGITRNATNEKIIDAVKKLVKLNNLENFTDPKERQKAQEKLKIVKLAYESLKDENKRFEYDLLLDEQNGIKSKPKKKSHFKLFTGLFLGTVAITAGSTTYLTKLDCSNIRNIVDSTVCEKTKPIRELFGSTDVAPPVVTAESANQTPSEKPVEKAPEPAVTNEPTPVPKEPDVKNTEPVNVAADNSVNTIIPVTQTAPVQETISTSAPVGSSNECYDLWYQRNLAYAQKGYCFESNLGKRVFSGFKCSQTPEPLSATEKDKINQIKQKESSLNCRLNTDSTDVPSSAPIASQTQTQIQPAATLQPAQPVVQQPTNTVSAPAMQTVIVEGVGTTPQDAAQNAAQNALTNVVGTFIDANTMLQKRTLINDGIKSETKNISKDIKEYSQGSIKSFEILDTQQQNGLFRVNAKVTVRNENFSAYIKQIAQGEVTVGNDLYAKMATGIKQKDNLIGILKDNVIFPILSGEVQDIEAEKPMLLSEAIEEKKLPKWLQYIDDAETHYFGLHRNSQNELISTDSQNKLIFKVNTGLKKDFLMNLNQTLLNISSSHKNLDANDASEFLENEGFKTSTVNNSIFLLKQIAKNPNIVELFEFQNLKVNMAELLGGKNLERSSGDSITKKSDVNLKITISDDSNSPLRIYSLDGSNKFRIYFEKGLRGENKSPWLLINAKSVIGHMARNTFFNVIEEHRSFYVVLEVDTETMKQMNNKITVTLDK